MEEDENIRGSFSDAAFMTTGLLMIIAGSLPLPMSGWRGRCRDRGGREGALLAMRFSSGRSEWQPWRYTLGPGHSRVDKNPIDDDTSNKMLLAMTLLFMKIFYIQIQIDHDQHWVSPIGRRAVISHEIFFHMRSQQKLIWQPWDQTLNIFQNKPETDHLKRHFITHSGEK